MSLVQKINEHLKAAMKNPDEAFKRDVLRQVIAKAKLTAKEDMSRSMADRENPTDADMLKALKKHMKQNEDAIVMYEKAGTNAAKEKMEKEVAEKEYLSTFLPKQKTEAEIAVLIDNIIVKNDIKENNGKSKGLIMKELGAYDDIDKAAAAKIVSDKLNKLS